MSKTHYSCLVKRLVERYDLIDYLSINVITDKDLIDYCTDNELQLIEVYSQKEIVSEE